MGRRKRSHRQSRQALAMIEARETPEARRQRVNAERGYDAPAFQKGNEHARRSQRDRRRKRHEKWINGERTIHYVRSGYVWRDGKYIPASPKASGITQSHSTNRAEARRQERQYRFQHGLRAKSKHAARVTFEAARKASLERVRQLKEDRKITRAKMAAQREAVRQIQESMSNG